MPPINASRFIAAFAGGTLVTAATPALVRHFGGGDDRLGWPLTMAFWGVAALVMFVITFRTTTERIAPTQSQPSSVLQDLADLRANRPWILLFILALIIMISITLRTTSSAYYFKYVVQRPDLLASFVPAYLLAAAAGAALTPVFTRFVDKRKLLIVLMTLTTLISAAFFFVRPDQMVLMYALQIALGLVLGPKSPLAYSMCADAAQRVGATHLVASTLIREAKQEAIAAASKRAADVPGNQELLLKRFFERTSTNSGVVLLDGHYTILNAQGEPVRLEADLFAALGVSTFLCIRGDAEAIASRLAARDDHGPSVQDVAIHQQVELDQAARVARQQGADVRVIDAFDTDSLVATLGG